MLLAYFGHHKCASTWINDILGEVCLGLGLRHRNVHNVRLFEGDLSAYVRQHRLDFLSYSNARLEYVHQLSGFRAFHVIRDPRDIIVSSYFSHLHSHPTDEWPALIAHRAELQHLDKEEGLRAAIDFDQAIGDIQRWDYTQERVLELKMEDLIRDPEQGFTQVFGFLGLLQAAGGRARPLIAGALMSARRRSSRLVPFSSRTLPERELVGTVRRNAFEKKSQGRAPGVEDVSSHYRKGVHGDWINHFSPAHKSYFKQKYGDLLVRLGYESGSEW